MKQITVSIYLALKNEQTYALNVNAATNTTLLIDDLYPWCRRLKRWLNAPESVTIRKMAPEACLCVCLQQIFGGFCLNFTLISFVLLYLDHSKTEWYCALSFEC